MPVALVGGEQEPPHRFGQPRLAALADGEDRGGELVRPGRPGRERQRQGAAQKDPAAHIFAPRSRSAFSTTDSDEALIAKAAKIGPIRMPKNGNRMPAAIGTPEAL